MVVKHFMTQSLDNQTTQFICLERYYLYTFSDFNTGISAIYLYQ